MTVPHILLHRPYAKGNTSWRMVEFCESQADARKLLTRQTFRVLDLFCVVPAEGISDIPKHVEDIYIATSRGQITEVILAVDERNFLDFYEGANSLASAMMRMLTHIPKTPLIRIATDSLASAFGACPNATHDAYVRDTVAVAEAWLRKENVREILETPVYLSGASYIRTACDSLRMALHRRYNHSYPRELIDCINGICGAYGGLFSDASTRKDMELANIVRHYVPLPVAMRSRL